MHADPGSWGIPTAEFAAFANQFLNDRATVAHAAGKPYILEETGMDNVSCYFLPAQQTTRAL